MVPNGFPARAHLCLLRKQVGGFEFQHQRLFPSPRAVPLAGPDHLTLALPHLDAGAIVVVIKRLAFERQAHFILVVLVAP